MNQFQSWMMQWLPFVMVWKVGEKLKNGLYKCQLSGGCTAPAVFLQCVFYSPGTLIFVFRDTSPFGTMVTIGGHYYGAGIVRLVYKEQERKE
jgi:hypothetical protein